MLDIHVHVKLYPDLLYNRHYQSIVSFLVAVCDDSLFILKALVVQP